MIILEVFRQVFSLQVGLWPNFIERGFCGGLMGNKVYAQNTPCQFGGFPQGHDQKTLLHSIIKSKSPEMEKHFLKNVGWGVGLENKDSTLVLNGKNQRTLKDGMTLIIQTGFQDIENPQPQDKNSKTYSLILNDTVRVTTAEPVVFTAEAPTTADANSFFFKDDEEQPTPKKEKRDSRVGAVATKNITNTRLRSERTAQVNDDSDTKRREHQKQLAAKKQKEGLVRFAEHRLS